MPLTEWKVSGKFENQERFSVVVMAYSTWNAQNIAKKMFAQRIVGMSAFKA